MSNFEKRNLRSGHLLRPGHVTFGVSGSSFFFINVSNCWLNSYGKFGGATRRPFFAICEKPYGGVEINPPAGARVNESRDCETLYFCYGFDFKIRTSFAKKRHPTMFYRYSARFRDNSRRQYTFRSPMKRILFRDRQPGNTSSPVRCLRCLMSPQTDRRGLWVCSAGPAVVGGGVTRCHPVSGGVTRVWS